MFYIILIVLIYLSVINVQSLETNKKYNVTKNVTSKLMTLAISQLKVPRKDNRTREYQIDARTKGNSEVAFRNKTILFWPAHWPPPYPSLEYIFNSKIHSCRVNNCIAKNGNHVENNLTKYDAVIHSQLFFKYYDPRILNKRSKKQKFIYLFFESSPRYPITKFYDNVFNLVMSYRLSSDIKIPYIYIYDKAGGIVGPKINMTWKQSMGDLSARRKRKLRSKTKFAAIFITNCNAKAKRLKIVGDMNRYLRRYNASKGYSPYLRNYNYLVDVYGGCSFKKCPQNDSISCDAMLERDYFFYLAFENSFAVDYVTEKLTRAVHTHTVPVVLGGADYSRFMPPGSYINACDRDPSELVRTLVDVMTNWTRYYEYFRFTDHYRYVNFDNDERFVCDLCEILNDENILNDNSRYKMLEKWHNKDISMTCQK